MAHLFSSNQNCPNYNFLKTAADLDTFLSMLFIYINLYNTGPWCLNIVLMMVVMDTHDVIIAIFLLHFLDPKMLAELDIFSKFFGAFSGLENFEMSAVTEHCQSPAKKPVAPKSIITRVLSRLGPTCYRSPIESSQPDLRV